MTNTNDGLLYKEASLQMAFDRNRIEDTNTVKSAKRVIANVTTMGGDKNEPKTKKSRIVEDTNTVKSAKRVIANVTTIGGDKNESKTKKSRIQSRKRMEIEQAKANAFAWGQKDLRKIATRRFL